MLAVGNTTAIECNMQEVLNVKTIINYQGDEITQLWKKYNEYSQKLAKALGKTNNIVGEYAEYLALQYTGGELLKISNSSADIRAEDGTLYQVKCRKIKNNLTTQLNVIRSWKFNFLFVFFLRPAGQSRKHYSPPFPLHKNMQGKMLTKMVGLLPQRMIFYTILEIKMLQAKLKSCNLLTCLLKEIKKPTQTLFRLHSLH